MQWSISRILLVLLFLPVCCFAQPTADTISTNKGKLVLRDDHTWSIVNEPGFDGVLNPRIHSIVSAFTPPVTQSWSNDVVFTESNNQLATINDTIWLCLNEFANDEKLDFCFPMKKIKVNSRYGPRSGRYHNGIDLDLNVGDTIYAMFSGKVRYAKYNSGGFGNLVILRHFNSLETFYAHLSKFLVAANEWVSVGQPIALGGNTGRSTGPHLHLEVRFYEEAINPEEIINFDQLLLKRENLFLHKHLFRPGAKPSDDMEVVSSQQVSYQQYAPSVQDAAAVIAPVVRPVVKTAKKKYHEIKSGDTLTKIARKYQTTVGSLCKLNGISVSSTLVIGRNLRVK
ncbi:MAG: LysM peptidoglycan-binding domain-containing protein [Flavobacteriia bacterium]|nr:LysM peptidoglycan-binding domain-containing protein [Flavobacteriia bacterium]